MACLGVMMSLANMDLTMAFSTGSTATTPRVVASSSRLGSPRFMHRTSLPNMGHAKDLQPALDHSGSSRKNSFLLGSRSSTKNTATTAVLASTALALVGFATFPGVSHALDLASLSGGAAAVATSTNELFAGFAETGFYQAFSLVFLSEIGDKTFFIAGLLAMKTSRLISFIGSMGALAVMTVISVVIGQVFHAVPAGLANGIPLDDVAAVLAFAFFGIKTLKEALALDGGSSAMDEELAEAEEEVEANDASKQTSIAARIFSIFGLVFAAEFGDRSFLSTIALSAAQNPVSVAVGATAAHAVATGIAVVGGAVVAKYLSEKVIGIIGGTLFLVFAVTTAFGIF